MPAQLPYIDGSNVTYPMTRSESRLAAAQPQPDASPPAQSSRRGICSSSDRRTLPPALSPAPAVPTDWPYSPTPLPREEPAALALHLHSGVGSRPVTPSPVTPPANFAISRTPALAIMMRLAVLLKMFQERYVEAAACRTQAVTCSTDTKSSPLFSALSVPSVVQILRHLAARSLPSPSCPSYLPVKDIPPQKKETFHHRALRRHGG